MQTHANHDAEVFSCDPCARTLHQILHLDLDIQYSLKIPQSQELVKFDNICIYIYICYILYTIYYIPHTTHYTPYTIYYILYYNIYIYILLYTAWCLASGLNFPSNGLRRATFGWSADPTSGLEQTPLLYWTVAGWERCSSYEMNNQQIHGGKSWWKAW